MFLVEDPCYDQFIELLNYCFDKPHEYLVVDRDKNTYCKKFNQPLDKWDVSKVKEMRFMFYECHAFNQKLNSWDVGNVQSMGCMFF